MIKPGALVDGPETDLGQHGQSGRQHGRPIDAPRGSGAVVLTLISDDNFSPLQRTLLLQFTLAE
jgi:hypothetical protein